MENLLQDLRYGFRQLSRTKVLSLAAILCIAIGVGANTTIFSLVNGILLRPIPGVSSSEGLLEMGRMHPDEDPMDTLSYPTWRDIIDGTESQVDTALWIFASMAISGDDTPEVVLGYAVTPTYFSVLGLEPARGRFFTEEEGRVEAAQSLAVISHGLWQRRFGGAEDIVGSTVRVNGTPTTVVGVAPERFTGHLSVVGGDMWVPLGMRANGLPDPEQLLGRFNNFLLGIGRLKPGVSLEVAQAAGSAAMAAVIEEFPQLERTDVGMAPLGSLPAFIQMLATIFLGALMVVVGLVLMIACINVAGILLSRGVARQREIAVRMAMGAGRGRLVRQLLTESLILFGVGGGVGVLAAFWTTGMLSRFQPPTPPPFVFAFDVGVDTNVLLFSLALTLGTGMLFGIGPALRATRPDLVPALKDEGSGSRGRSRFRGFLVAGQMAMTVILLVAAGLFLRALVSARSIDPGFNPDGVLAMSLDLELHGYEQEQGRRFLRDVRQQLEELPSVDAASAAALLPLGMPVNMSLGGVNVDGFEPPTDESSWEAPVNLVTPGYFATLEIPLLQGRDFDDRDLEGAPQVAIINETMANHFWPSGDAVGSEFIIGSFENGERWQVVGVARDSKYQSLSAETPFFTYLPMQQSYRSRMSLQIRARDASVLPLDAVRGVIDRIDPDLPFLDVISLREYIEVGFLPQRVAGSVAGVLGLVGLLLGAVGIYGVTSYGVSQRIHEIGMRKALGADGGGVRRMVVRQGMMAPVAGMFVGLVTALALSRLLAALLIGVSPLDPVTFGGVLTLLSVVAVCAVWLPARRAARLDPMQTLRAQ
jgi:predicted permease